MAVTAFAVWGKSCKWGQHFYVADPREIILPTLTLPYLCYVTHTMNMHFIWGGQLGADFQWGP